MVVTFAIFKESGKFPIIRSLLTHFVRESVVIVFMLFIALVLMPSNPVLQLRSMFAIILSTQVSNSVLLHFITFHTD